MKLTLDEDWTATVTGDPLRLTPRFAGASVSLVDYADVNERERFLLDTCGSQEWLWDAPDVFRFDKTDGVLVGAEFHWPEESASAEDVARLPLPPAVRQGWLRADEARDFRHERCTVLCRAPGDAVLTCLRDLDVLDEPLEACIGIAPDVALLVQHGTVGTHEAGRVFGLGHVPADPTHAELTMYPSSFFCSEEARTLGYGDVLGLRKKY